MTKADPKNGGGSGLQEGEQGMTETATTSYRVVDGALTEVPAFESHQRGRNWMARIKADPRSPAGIDRDFREKAYGAYYYMVAGLERGDALEFGADYYSGGGKKHPRREYAAVAAVSEDALELALFDSPEEALAAAEEIQRRDAPTAVSGLADDELEVARRLSGLQENRVRRVVEAAEELRRGEAAGPERAGAGEQR